MNSTQSGHEEWRPVPDYEGIYEVSDQGNVRSLTRQAIRSDGKRQTIRGRMMKQAKSTGGYMMFPLQKAGVRKQGYTHKIVMAAFVGPRPEGMDICHNNGDPTDNRLTNLRYDTHAGNMSDKRGHGTDYQFNKTHCPNGHPLVEPNLTSYHTRMGWRSCLSCSRARDRVRDHGLPKEKLKSISDSYYADIMKLGPVTRPRCNRGHLFVEGNITINATNGRKHCTSCRRATKRKHDRPESVPSIKDLADEFYRRIVPDDGR